jgi:DNA mismatch repair protein MutS
MMVVYLEVVKCWKTKREQIVAGWSYLDTLTGSCRSGEVTTIHDAKLFIDELHRIMLVESPSELVITSNDGGIDNASSTDNGRVNGTMNGKGGSTNQLFSHNIEESVELLIHSLDISFHNMIGRMALSYHEKAYQEKILNKVFPNTGLLSPIEYIDMETTPLSLVSFLYLVQFAYEHNESIVMKISKPLIVDHSNGEYLTLAANSVLQLDITTHGNLGQTGPSTYQSNQPSKYGAKTSCLLHILNRCRTAVGRRYFKNRLLNPSCRVHDIIESYDKTETMLQNDVWKSVGKGLSGVVDIERLYRRMQMNKIQPCEFVNMCQSIMMIHNTMQLVYNETGKDGISHFPSIERLLHSKDIDNFKAMCESTLDMDQALKYNLDTVKESIFKRGYSSEVDDICDEMKYRLKRIEEPLFEIPKASNGDWDGWFKLEHNDKDGYFYVVTEKRLETVRNAMSNRKSLTKLGYRALSSEWKSILGEGVDKKNKPRTTSQSVKLQTQEMKKLGQDINDLRERLKSETVIEFRKFTDRLQQKHDEFIKLTVRGLETFDFHATCARNSVEMCHIRPDISLSMENNPNDTIEMGHNGNTIDRDTNTNTQHSFIDVHDLRHPIIEYVQTNLKYVPNTIRLGSRGAGGPNGMILYGVNAAGKSSFMKSVGIALIMAQAGMHVPARKMTYYPYNSLFTRIQSCDDIYRGMSTFSMEIGELRNILKRADMHSLIIGDELCSGTETVSAVSIVCAGIETLVKTDSTFLFATHLHQLMKLEAMDVLERNRMIQIKHLSVKYDERTDSLIYDRQLRDGSGQELYGLEVCKALDLDPEFLHRAGKIRHDLLQGTHVMVSNSVSRYNSNVIVDECQVCGKRREQTPIETHHICFQSTADSRGMVDEQVHKNHGSNLVPLCEKCHDAVHNDHLQIYGWAQTTKGVRLCYEWVSSAISDDVFVNMRKHREDIMLFRKSNSVKKTNEYIRTKYGMQLSDYKLGKLLREII